MCCWKRSSEGRERSNGIRQGEKVEGLRAVATVCFTDGAEGARLAREGQRNCLIFAVQEAGTIFWQPALPKMKRHARLPPEKKRTQNHGDLEQRVSRAMTPIELGEVTVGKQALECAYLAPETQETLRQLRQRPAKAWTSCNMFLTDLSLGMQTSFRPTFVLREKGPQEAFG